MTPLLRANTCSTCAFRERDARGVMCRFYPPTVTPVIIADPNGQPKVHSQINSSPRVADDYWCGQFKPRMIALNDPEALDAKARAS